MFTVREVFPEMLQAGTRYAESTVLTTMQRMKEPPQRPPFIRLERAGREGFRLWLGFEGFGSKICSRGWGLTQRRDRPNVVGRRSHRLSVLATVRPLSSPEIKQQGLVRRTEELRNG